MITTTIEVAAIVLAAGASTRLGRPKQLVRMNGVSLIRRAAQNAIASGARRIAVVVPPSSEIVRELDALEVAVLVNRAAQDGMASSLQLALARMYDADAVLITLCDQPLVPAAHLRALTANAARDRIIATAFGDTVGVPACVGAAFFTELAKLTGDRGARAVISRHLDVVTQLRCEEAAIDVDTAEDLSRLTGDPSVAAG